MVTKSNFTFLNIDSLTIPSPKTLGVLACGSAAIALWHRIDRRNDMEENKVRNNIIQTTFLSLSSMFGMLWALSGSNVPSMTQAVATFCAGATTTIPVDIVAARSFSSYQEEPELKKPVQSFSSDTPITTPPKQLTEEVVTGQEEASLDQV
jgi:hypothetical protein